MGGCKKFKIEKSKCKIKIKNANKFAFSPKSLNY